MTYTKHVSKTSRSVFAAACVAVSLAVTGCAGGSSANTVSTSAQGYASTVRQGTVVSARAVTIKPDRSIVGAATGAVLGGLAGSEVGGGDKAQTAGGVVGAVGGAVIGNEAGKALGTKQGIAVTIDFGDGNLKEFVQAADITVQPGQLVNVTFRQDGAYVSPAQAAPVY